MNASQRKVLNLLKQAGSRGVLTGEFTEARIHRASARIHELNAQGYKITPKRLTQSSWRYTLEAGSSAGGRGEPVGVPDPPLTSGSQCDPSAAPSFDPTEAGRWEVRHVEPLPSQAHEWEHVLRFTPGEITAEYWRRATPMQQAMAA